MAMIPTVKNRCCCILKTESKVRRGEGDQGRGKSENGPVRSVMRLKFRFRECIQECTHFQIIFFNVPLALSIPESVCVNCTVMPVDQYTGLMETGVE
jgi:hypothetical protein